MADNLRISLVQAHIVWEDIVENLRYYGELLRRVQGKTDVVVLPEMFSTGFSMNVESLAEPTTGLTIQTVKQWSRKYNLAIAGSFMALEDGCYYNRGFFITPEEQEFYYDKRHLFRMGKENAFFTSGNKRLIVNYKNWNICLMICYDLRFPVWSRNVDNEYDLLVYCANWPESRRHVWNVLLEARAIENMCYVCGVNRVGTDGAGVVYCGDSVVISPKGQTVVNAGKRIDVIRTSTLNREELKTLRSKFPCSADADSFTIGIFSK